MIDMLNKMIYPHVHYKSDFDSKIEASKELFERYTKRSRSATTADDAEHDCSEQLEHMSLDDYNKKDTK